MNQHPSLATNGHPFAVRDCALISLATGVLAQNLREFRDGLLKVPAGCIYHHFWGRLLRPQFDEPEYNNDFASWAYWGLHDKPLAERLSMVLPSDYADLEDLRQEVVEVVEQRLDEMDTVPWAQVDQRFGFLQSQIVVFDTGMRFEQPLDLVPYVPGLSTGSIFYHFIDARRRTESHGDDFSSWLGTFGQEYAPLKKRLAGVDPYFSSLKEIRQIVTTIFQTFFEEKA